MKHELRFHRIEEHLGADLKPFQALVGHLPALRAHSSLHLDKFSTSHPQIAQRKQRHQLRGVLGKALVAHLGKAELALDDSKRVFSRLEPPET